MIHSELRSVLYKLVDSCTLRSPNSGNAHNARNINSDGSLNNNNAVNGNGVVVDIQLAILDPLDHIIKEQLHIRHYLRYNDDMIIIHNVISYLRYCKDVISSWLMNVGLHIHTKKTQIFPLTHGIRFIGYRYKLTETCKVIMTLLHEKVSHERRKLKRLVKRYAQGMMTKSHIDRCYAAWKSCTGNQHRPNTNGRKAHRNTHNLILMVDQFYKSLWKGVSTCSDTSLYMNN